MTRALVLNAGAAWCSYQLGALRHLVGERSMQFDLCAGTGLGAMNAAFVACGRLGALEEFWDDLGALDLLPARRRRFMAAHLSDDALAEREVRLIVTAVDLRRGRVEVLRYPGCSLPLVEGLLAAGALPGMTRAVSHGAARLVEATVVDSTPMDAVLAEEPAEVTAVLGMLPVGGGPLRRYRTWRAVGRRALEVNQSADAHRALVAASQAAAEAEAHRLVDDRLRELAAGTADGNLARALDGLADSPERARGPVVRAIHPSRDMDLAMWRFRSRDLHRVAALGEEDARHVLSTETGEADP